MTNTSEATPAEESQPPVGAPKHETSRFRPLIITGVLAAVAAVLLLAVFQGGRATSADGSFDQLVFVNEDGSTGTLADHRGEPLVVNFFASWCAPCRAEIPVIERVKQASDGQVAFIGVSHDLNETAWKSFVAEANITYPTVFQPDQQIWKSLDLNFLPATVFITPDGNVAHTYAGILTDETLRDLITAHLAVKV